MDICDGLGTCAGHMEPFMALTRVAFWQPFKATLTSSMCSLLSLV